MSHSRWAYSYLFVPGNRLDRVFKALGTEADIVIVDLEDAVHESQKNQTRGALSAFVSERSIYVRINGSRTKHHEKDLEMLTRMSWLSGVVVPMVEAGSDLDATRSVLGTDISVIALIETARGIVAADEVASSGIARLAFGCVDYASDVGASQSDELFAYPRSRLVVASAAAGLPAPVDGPSVSFKKLDALAVESRTARRIGMGAKFCIHPAQVAEVNRTFAPTEAEMEWARKVIAAANNDASGASAISGEMVDAPVVARARGILGQ